MNPKELSVALRDLIEDARVREIILPALSAHGTPDFALASRVRAVLPHDSFSISQFVFGMSYFKDVLNQTLHGGRSLIDLGCGAGAWSLAGAEIFEEVMGVDSDRRRLDAAQELARQEGKTQLKFYQADISTFRAAGPFDHAICINTVQCLGDDQLKFLSNLRSLIRPSGTCLVGFPDRGYFEWLKNHSSLRWWVQYYFFDLINRVRGRRSVRTYLRSTDFESLAAEAGWTSIKRLKVSGRIFPTSYEGMPLWSEYLLTNLP